MKEEATARFLILRFESDTEVLLTTPVIRCLKEQVAGAEVHYVTDKDHARLLEGNPYLHKIHILEDPVGSLIEKLKGEEFDYIIDLQGDLKAERIKSGLKRMSFDVAKTGLRKWILVRLGVNLLSERHWAELCLDTLKVFDVDNDNRGLDLPVPAHEEVNAENLPPDFQRGYVAFVMGARYQTRRLPSGMITEICNRIGVPVVLIGGIEDAGSGEEVAGNTITSVWNGCGRYTFWQSASLVRQAKLVITHDTTMMQVAAAFGQRIVSVWGNTIPGFGMTAYMPHEDSRIFQTEGLRCRPCSVQGYSICPKKHFHCMLDIDLSELVNYVTNLLKSV